MEEKIVTPAGLKKYKNELAYLKGDKRKELAERIRAAKEQGDLSENAEYSTAKDEQDYMERRIEELEMLVKTVKVVHATRGTSVGVGSTVDVELDGEKITFEMVGANEAEPGEGRISIESAVGSALMEKNKGDVAVAETPGGSVEYKILDVRN